MDAKVTSILCYFGLIFWLVAYFAGDKDAELSKRHLNQGLVCCIGYFIPIVNFVALVFAVMGIIKAVKEDDTPLPVIGGINILK